MPDELSVQNQTESAEAGTFAPENDAYAYDDLLDPEDDGYEEEAQDDGVETEDAPADPPVSDVSDAPLTPHAETANTSRRSVEESPVAVGAFELRREDLFSPEERAVLDQLFDEDQQGWLLRAVQRGVEAGMVHRERQEIAQKRAIKSLNLPSAVMQEYDEDLQEALAQIPPQLRGTQRSGDIALDLVLHNRIQRSGDRAGELERMARLLRGQEQKPAAPPPQSQSSPPASSRPETRPLAPRVSDPGANRGRARRPSAMDDIAELWGLTESQRRAIADDFESTRTNGTRRR